MSTRPRHKWSFTTQFRANAYGWSGTRLVCQRIKEALSEIKAVAVQDPVTGAEGALILLEKMYPAIACVDSSSGALGSATYSAVESLSDIIAAAQPEPELRSAWLNRLWIAFEEDGVGYLENIADRWGDLCGSTEVANIWANELLAALLTNWDEDRSGQHTSYFRGTSAVFSCMLKAGRYQEVLDVVELAPFIWWNYRRFGVLALAAAGRLDEAIAYARASRDRNTSLFTIDSTCERLLLDAGRWKDAYHEFAMTATLAGTNLAKFRAISKKYPEIPKQQVLEDLVSHSDAPGKWFATAKELKLFDYALTLVKHAPADPLTLNRAVRDYEGRNAEFALGAALASVRWIVAGHGYDLVPNDFIEPYKAALRLGAALGSLDVVQDELELIVGDDKNWSKVAQSIIV